MTTGDECFEEVLKYLDMIGQADKILIVQHTDYHRKLIIQGKGYDEVVFNIWNKGFRKDVPCTPFNWQRQDKQHIKGYSCGVLRREVQNAINDLRFRKDRR